MAYTSGKEGGETKVEGIRFGEEIARLRKKKRYSIREFAKKVMKEDGEPMSASYLCDIEQGRKKPPSLEVIRRMAELLGAKVDDLVVLARRTPPDIKEIVQGSPEVRRMLRKARELGFRDWKQVEKLIEMTRARKSKRIIE
jgi:transcriptional regulator with XRE-family HTH domain